MIPANKATSAATKGYVADLRAHFRKDLAAQRQPVVIVNRHKDVLEEILKHVKSIDFRRIVGLENDSDKLRQKHYLVSVAEEVIQIAKRNQWGLCLNNGRINIYNGAFWKAVEDAEVREFLKTAAQKMGVDRYDARHFVFAEQLHKQFLADAYLPSPDKSDDAVKINLKNGTFHVSTRKQELTGFQASDFLTHQLPFNYDPESSAPLFTEFLNKVLPDLDTQKLLAEYIGYLFVPSSQLKLEKALLLYGQGANGKSVFFDVVRALLGSENITHYSLCSLTTGPAYSRIQLGDKLVNYASELSGRMDVDVFKQLVSGEPVEVRSPYGQPFIMTSYAKLIFNCNHLPQDVEHTHAFFRRLLPIPFSVTIPAAEQDKQLASKIIASELSGVFNWVLDGLTRLLHQGGFTESAVVVKQIQDYQQQSDSVRSFLDDRGYEPHPELYTTRQDLYKEYRSYCIEEGDKPLKSGDFVTRLASASIAGVRRSFGHVHFVVKRASHF